MGIAVCPSEGAVELRVADITAHDCFLLPVDAAVEITGGSGRGRACHGSAGRQQEVHRAERNKVEICGETVMDWHCVEMLVETTSFG